MKNVHFAIWAAVSLTALPTHGGEFQGRLWTACGGIVRRFFCHEKDRALDPFVLNGEVLRFSLHDGYHLMINGQLVAGSDFYPTETIEEGLRIFPEDILKWRGEKSRVLVVPNSFQGLLPHLVANDVDVTGLDLLNGVNAGQIPKNAQGRKLFEFQTRFAPHLKGGNALDMPFEGGSFDVVLSFQLVNGEMTRDQTHRFLDEVFRVAPIGEHKIYGFTKEGAEDAEAYIRAHHPEALISSEQVKLEWISYGKYQAGSYLLVIQIAPTHSVVPQ